MAKQSGIHQLRGKVGEHSYYKQTGVASGLVRSINPGMSARVKTSEEYANVRLNNREFGQAGRLAAMLARYITPKFRPMVLPFSQSKMAKVLLEFIKQDTSAPWGGRNLTISNNGEAQVTALNSVVKNRFEDWGIQITGDEEHSTIQYSTTSETNAKAAAIGAKGFIVRTLAVSSWIGTYDENNRRYDDSFARANIYEEDVEAGSTHNWNVEYVMRPTPPKDWPAFQGERMGIAILLPYREVNAAPYILQEHCTYFSWVIADGRIM